MLKDINNAQSSIFFEQYLFNDLDKGEIGKIFLEALLKKAKEGVKVKLLIDSIGSTDFFFSNEPENLEKHGIDLRFHALSRKSVLSNIFPNLYRDHRKTVVIDEKIGYIGGVVIGQKMEDWRDTQVRIENDLVPLLKASFDAIWNSLEKTSVRPHKYMNRHLNENAEGFLGNCPREKNKALRKEILSKISQSKKRVWITTPYFVPSRKMVKVFKKAAKRNVDVRIVIGSRTDSRLGDFIAKSYFKGLLKNNIQIFRFTEMIHAKTVVVDDWVSVGSFNFDYLSEYFNHELNLVTQNKEVLESIVSQFTLDFKNSIRYTSEDYKREPSYKKIAWHLLNLFKVF